MCISSYDPRPEMLMTFRGTMKKGVVVFAKAPRLKEGTAVRVQPIKPPKRARTTKAVGRATGKSILRPEALMRQFVIWELDAKAAVEFGRLRAELRSAGQPIPIFDVLIAAIARSNNLVLLTADRHFNSVDGLAVENWLA